MNLKRVLIVVLLIPVLIFTGFSGLSLFLAGPHKSTPLVFNNPDATGLYSKKRDQLRVMTLNLSHGRGVGMLNIMVTEDRARENLLLAADLIRQSAPDVIALQEADDSAFLSGGFNHIRLLTSHAGMAQAALGSHVKGPGLSYGTAMISALPLHNPQSRTFTPTPPTMPKGFTVASVPWPGPSFGEINIVSVHLDFLFSTNRKRQVETMAFHLQQLTGPMIVAGDFNCGWHDADSAVKQLAIRLQLKAWIPDDDHEPTFPAAGSRIDWILISSELRFHSHQVIPRAVSDHLAVAAVIIPEIVE